MLVCCDPEAFGRFYTLLLLMMNGGSKEEKGNLEALYKNLVSLVGRWVCLGCSDSFILWTKSKARKHVIGSSAPFNYCLSLTG